MAYLYEIEHRKCDECRHRPAKYELRNHRNERIRYVCGTCAKNALASLEVAEQRQRMSF